MKKNIKKTTNQMYTGKNFDLKTFTKTWAIRLFYTAFMFGTAYLIIISTVLNIPTVIPFVIGGMGFSVTTGMSNAEYIVAFCAGIFLTLWLFTMDFVIIRAGWRLYIKKLHAIKQNNTSSDK